MTPQLRAEFEQEMEEALRLYRSGQLNQAFKHLETSHVLGQRHIVPHAQTHWLMLKIGLRRHSLREVVGQTVRIFLGVFGSAIGMVPTGNTGGTDIGMFKRLPIAPNIAKHLDKKRCDF